MVSWFVEMDFTLKPAFRLGLNQSHHPSRSGCLFYDEYVKYLGDKQINTLSEIHRPCGVPHNDCLLNIVAYWLWPQDSSQDEEFHSLGVSHRAWFLTTHMVYVSCQRKRGLYKSFTDCLNICPEWWSSVKTFFTMHPALGISFVRRVCDKHWAMIAQQLA